MIDKDIEILKDFTKKDYEPWSFYEKQGDELFELQEAIENVLKELEPLRELNIPTRTLVAEYKRLENIEDNTAQLKYELETYKKIADFMAEYIDRVDTKHSHCAGYLCTVATTCYSEEERKIICCNCIKNWARNEVENYGNT